MFAYFCLRLETFQREYRRFPHARRTSFRPNAKRHGELKGELKNLMELNRRITAKATNLFQRPQRKFKVQGDWGEMISDDSRPIRDLIRGVRTTVRVTIKDDEGNNQRPDVVLYLPEGKRIVIDSKVSLATWSGSVPRGGARTRYLAACVGAAACERTEPQGVPAVVGVARLRHHVHSQRTGLPGGHAATTTPSGASAYERKVIIRRLRTSSRC